MQTTKIKRREPFHTGNAGSIKADGNGCGTSETDYTSKEAAGGIDVWRL